MVGAQTCSTPKPSPPPPLPPPPPPPYNTIFVEPYRFVTDLKELFPSVSMDVYGHLATKKWTRRQPTRHEEVSSPPSNVSALINVFTQLGLLT